MAYDDPYAGMNPQEAEAARSQDIQSRNFLKFLRESIQQPPVVRRPGYQAMAGAAARSQALNPERVAQAQKAFEDAQIRIEANRNRLDPSRPYANDPGIADYEPYTAAGPAPDSPPPAQPSYLLSPSERPAGASAPAPSGKVPEPSAMTANSATDAGRGDYDLLYKALNTSRGVAPIGQIGSLPMMARKDEGKAPVAPNVQDRTVDPSLLAMAGQRIAPYSMQFTPKDLQFSQGSTPNRPAAPPAKPAAAAAPAAAPAQGGNFFSNLFKGGPDVQSNNQLLVQRQQGPMQPGQERATTKLNWGDRDSAADFFRADQARQALEKSGEAFTGMKRGGAAQAPGKDAALHKALEIIHHMITRGH
jgi:hypothetical protein